MTTGNLSTVIGPALLWSESKETEGAAKQLESINVALKITTVLIDNCASLNSLKEAREKEKQRQEETATQQKQSKVFLTRLVFLTLTWKNKRAQKPVARVKSCS